MQEFKFKIGDKVRLVVTTYPDGAANGIFRCSKVGTEFFVQKYTGATAPWSNGSLVIDIVGYPYRVCESMLELVEEFKCNVEPDNSWPRQEQQNCHTLGLKPRKIHNQQRIQEIVAAISRYTEANKEIPVEWFEEYNDLVNKEKL